MTSLELEVNAETMKPPTNPEAYVTVLKVNNDMERQLASSGFVTVVELEGCKGSSARWQEAALYEEEVTMYRLPGERLGMGLKFEGGMQAFECVSHVYIQSVAADSPAARTETSWGGLAEGDEILKIDGRSVGKMTRVDCVTTLKKAPVAIKLYIRHGTSSPARNGALATRAKTKTSRPPPLAGSGPEEPPPPLPAKNSSRPSPQPEVRGKAKALELPSLPPPVPPRKLRVRKESPSPDSSPPATGSRLTPRHGDAEDGAADGDGYRGGGVLGMKLPGWEELVLRRSSTSPASEDVVLPVPCDTYTDLIAEEDKRSLLNEYESDDTGSSASTVIERLSSAVANVHALTGEPVVTLAARSSDKASIDLSQVLSPFEQLEKEIEVDFSVDDDVLDELPLIVDNKAIEPPENFKDSNPDLLQRSHSLPPESRPAVEDALPELSTAEGGHEAPPNGVNSNYNGNNDSNNRNSNTVSDCNKKPPLNAMEQEKNALNSLADLSLQEIHPPPKRKITPPPVPPRKLKSVKRTNSQEATSPTGPSSDGGLLVDDLDDPIANLTFPIIGNLLQELEQLPEFNRPTTIVSGERDISVSAESDSAPLTVKEVRDPVTSHTATDDLIVVNQSADPNGLNEISLQTEICALAELEPTVALDSVDRENVAVTSQESSLQPSSSVESIASPDLLDAKANSDTTTSSENKTNVLDSQRVLCSDDEDLLVLVGGGHSEDSLLSVSGSQPSANGSSCEVVAVIEKPSLGKHVIGRTDPFADKSATMASDATTLLNLSDDAFTPAFSRLPPDGHEFPPNYLESDGTGDVTMNGDSLDKDPMPYEKPWIQPPVGFDDAQRRSSAKTTPPQSESLDDASTASSRSSDTGDTIIYNECPPPVPSMDLDSQSSSDADVFSGDEAPYDVSPKDHLRSEPETKRTPPVPPKRHLAPQKPTAAPPPVPERASKVEESLLSVKDKIALFVAKTEMAAPASLPKPQAARRSLPVEKTPDVPNGSASGKTLREDIESVVDSTECDPQPPPLEVATVAVVKPNDEGPIGSCNSSVGDYCHNRSESSLSMSSSFSKSSDDLLSQDVDSSDVDEHPSPVVASLDRKHPHPAKPTATSGLRPNGPDAKSGRAYWSTSSTDSDVTDSRLSPKPRSMYSILETRKQNVSKLKGLVIPHVQQDGHQTPVTAAPELPLIFSVDSILLPKVELTKPPATNGHAADVGKPELPAMATMPRTSLLSSGSLEIPKYSPAFKRKPFTLVQEAPPVSDLGRGSAASAAPPVADSGWTEAVPPPLPKSLPPLPEARSASVSRQVELKSEDLTTFARLDNLMADTEDQESGISSIESPNVSIHNTPPGSPKEFHSAKLAYVTNVREMTQSLDSATSLPAKSSGWESNGSSTDSESSVDPRILKANSVEAINRKNVLQSSRHSSGGFDDEDDYSATNGAPESPFGYKTFAATISGKDAAKPRKISLEERVTVYKVDVRKEKRPLVAEVTKPLATVSDERWSELERKYAPKHGAETGRLTSFHKSSSEEGLLDKLTGPTMTAANGTGRNFRALAERWEQRSNETAPPAGGMRSSAALSKSLTSITQNSAAAKSPMTAIKPASVVQPTTADAKKPTPQPRCTNVNVTMRDKNISLIARPVSLVDAADTRRSKLWEVAFENGTKSTRSSIESTIQYASKPRTGQPPDLSNGKSRRSTSFNDLRQIFENQEMSLPQSRKGGVTSDVQPGPKDITNHMRMSSLDSTCSESDFGPPAHYGSATSLGSIPMDHYGSITSLASSTSLISPQELQQLIDEANQSLEESGTPLHEITVVVLQREIPGGSIGITLAGGADYDSKEITVNKVIAGSLADRDGRIQKGDRVLSINGKNLKGVTHREALHILKAPRTDCVLVLSRSRSSSPQDGKENGNVISRTANTNFRSRVSRITPPQQTPPLLTMVSTTSLTADVPKTITSPLLNGSASTPALSSSVVTMELVKDASGLGFSLDGGKDSPQGDKPLTIKKIFQGGAADKHGLLHVGDEVLSINRTDVTKMSRIEAWRYMRKLPDGPVQVIVSHAK